DQPSGYRLHGLALLRAGRTDEACKALTSTLELMIPSRQPPELRAVLEDDLLLALRATSCRPNSKDDGASFVDMELPPWPQPGARIALYWESDASDFVLHVYDADHEHVSFDRRQSQRGGALSVDVRTGYGPECFSAEGPALAYPYLVQVEARERG